jgi:hypothetical protein
MGVNSPYPLPGGLVAGVEHGDHQLVRLGPIERLGERAGAVLPYIMLVVSCALTAARPPSHRTLVVTLILSAVIAGWMLFVFTLRPAWRENQPVMGLFIAVWLAITAVLVSIDGWFGFFSFTGPAAAHYLGAGD